MNIQISNCNNINAGSIDIMEGRLNIKYAINGTGKSTIARAMELCRTPKQLISLLPYKYLIENPLQDEHKPIIQCNPEIRELSIFNEEYMILVIFKCSESN